jgi:hypothetical protein
MKLTFFQFQNPMISAPRVISRTADFQHKSEACAQAAHTPQLFSMFSLTSKATAQAAVSRICLISSASS